MAHDPRHPYEDSPLRRAGLMGMVLGLLGATAVIWQTSTAALTATTSNSTNTFAAGTVTLTDDDTGTYMFNSTNMVPGTSVTRCIKVTYGGSSFQVTPVKLYAAVPTQTNTFSSNLDTTIEEGNGGTFASCTGFTATSTLYSGRLSTLASTNANFATGLSGFTPISGSANRTYRVTVTLRSDTPNTAQGDTATANFSWEVQSA